MASSTNPLKPGDMVDGKYLVERVVGEGGMGIVVAARHLDLGRPVAIKVLREEFTADAEQAARFLREARAAVQLTGEHSVRVLDVGRLSNGSPFLVMERLHGRDLGQVTVAEGALSIAEAVDYVLQACEGIAEAHARGLVHRDLKLANLFLTKRGDGHPLIKVLDFGLVKSTGPHQDHLLTRSHAVMGLPAYMSPEQLRASRDVTAATDIWSLGVCLYELVTGRLPFDAPNVADLMIRVLQNTAPRMHELRHDVPPGLSEVVHRCLAKEATDRFPDVAELARALEPFAGATATGASVRVERWLVQSAPEITEVAPSPAAAATSEQVRTEAAWDSVRREARTRRITTFAGALLAGLAAVAAWAALATPRAKPEESARPIAAASSLPATAASSASVTATPVSAPAVAASSDEPQAGGGPIGAASVSSVDASLPPAAAKRPPPPPAKRGNARPAPRADAGYNTEAF